MMDHPVRSMTRVERSNISKETPHEFKKRFGIAI